MSAPDRLATALADRYLMERFLQEIHVTAHLQHPHILPLFDSGEADSFLFYVMPYLEGESVRDRLSREKQLPIEDAVKIAEAVASPPGHSGVMARPRRPRQHPRVREADAPEYASSARVGLSGVLFDSDVVIEILRGRSEVVRAALDLEGGGVPTYCTPIFWAEVYAGLRLGEEAATRGFFEARGEAVLDGLSAASISRGGRVHD